MAAKKARAKKDPKGREATNGEAKARKKPDMSKVPKSVTTGRYETTLTDALVDELCAIHQEGDILPSTALACGVHPTLLRRWLEEGSRADAKDPFARLFATFAVIESQIRRTTLQDIRNPYTKNTNGLTWYMEKRFREWRADSTPRENEIFAVSDMLLPKPGGMDVQQAVYIIGQLFQNVAALPPVVQQVLQLNRIVQLPEGKPDGQVQAGTERADEPEWDDGDDDGGDGAADD